MTWQKIEVPFSGGLYEKAQPEAGPAGSFTRLENARQTRDGSFRKRNGIVSLSNTILGGGAITSGKKILARRDSPLLVGTDSGSVGTNLYAYSPKAGAWQRAGLAPPCAVSRLQVAGMQLQPEAVDIGYTNGFFAVAWSVADTAGGNKTGWLRIVDASGGERLWTSASPLIDSTMGLTGSNPIFRLVTVGNFFFALWRDDNATQTIKYRKFDTTAPASGWTASATLPNCTNLHLGFIAFDAFGDSTQFYVAYGNSTAASQLDVRAYDTTATQTSAKTGYAPSANPIEGIAIGGLQTDTIWVATGAGSTFVIGLSPGNVNTTIATQTAVLNVDGAHIGLCRTGTGTGLVYAAGGGNNFAWRNFKTTTGAVDVSGSVQRGAFRMAPITRPFIMGGRVYCQIVDATGTSGLSDQNMTALVDITDAATDPTPTPWPAACPAPRLGVLPSKMWITSGATQAQGPAHVAVNGSKVYAPQVVLKSQATGVGAGAASSFDILIYDFAATSRWMGGGIGQAFLLGPQPYQWDGTALTEVGFFTTPAKPVVSAVAGGLTAGTYTFVAIYEEVSSSGAVEWSAPSPPSTPFVADGSHNASVVVKTLQVTAKDLFTVRPRIVLYASVGGSAYQRVTGSETINDPTVDSVTIVVSATDASAPQLYTTPGATIGATRLPKQIPGPLNILITHNDRFIGLDDSANVWFSGGYIYGEAVWFSSAFQFPVDAGRPATALGSQEGRIWIFKRDRIFYVDGDGPDDTGAGFYGLPSELPAGGVGCIEPRSVVTTSLGVFYQSEQGIYLVSRGGEVQFIGKGIEQTSLLTTPIFTSAVLHQGQAHVLFTAWDGGTNARRFAYDLVHNSWSQDRPMALGGGDVVFQSAAMVGGNIGSSEVWYACDSGGTVYTETTSTYLDTTDAIWQSSVVQTSWIKLDGEQGWNRIRNVKLLAQNLAGHNLTMSLAYDYNPTPVDTRTWTDTEIAALVTTREQLGVSCTRQKVEAIQVTISDASPSSLSAGTGQGAILMGLSFEVQPKTGTYRLPTANEK